MCKKYELTGEVMEYERIVLHRIRAIKNFGDVKIGYLGGWIESEDNLSQEGLCWVHGNAMVYGNAKVYDNAKVYGCAKVYGSADIHGDAKVFGDARVFNNAEVFGNAKVYDNAEVFNNTKVSGDAEIKNPTDYIVIGPIGSRNDYTTFYKTKDSNIHVVCGCFIGTIDEFEARIKETHKGNKYEKAYLNAITLANHVLS